MDTVMFRAQTVKSDVFLYDSLCFLLLYDYMLFICCMPKVVVTLFNNENYYMCIIQNKTKVTRNCLANYTLQKIFT